MGVAEYQNEAEHQRKITKTCQRCGHDAAWHYDDACNQSVGRLGGKCSCKSFVGVDGDKRDGADKLLDKWMTVRKPFNERHRQTLHDRITSVKSGNTLYDLLEEEYDIKWLTRQEAMDQIFPQNIEQFKMVHGWDPGMDKFRDILKRARETWEKLDAQCQKGDRWVHVKSPFCPLCEREHISIVRGMTLIDGFMLRMS
jgi:hypothetical protein